MRELRVQYLTEIRDDLLEMRTTTTSSPSGFDAEQQARMRKLSHDLRGSGGAYGFPAISTTAGALEDLVVAGTEPSALEPALAALERAVDAAVAGNTG